MEKQLKRTLAEVGFLAVNNFFFTQGENIFAALEADDPDALIVKVGKSFFYLMTDQFQLVIDLLEKDVCREEEEPSMCDVLYCIACSRLGYLKEAERLIEYLGRSEDKSMINLANELKSDFSK